MASAQRQASRFFAAFYRWERHAAASRYCNSTHSRPRCLPKASATLPTARSFATTRTRSQDGANEPSPRGSTSDQVSESYPEDSSGALAQDALKESVRALMRFVPHPVVVLTAAGVDSDGRSIPLGSTVSSFTTVTLSPPTISFNLKHPSRTLDAIRADNGRFRVHFMSSSREGAMAATAFTRGNNESAYAERCSYISKDDCGDDTGPKPAELLPEYAIAAMQCKVIQEVLVADHVIVVAGVSSMSNMHNGEFGLMYANGLYIKQRLQDMQSSLLGGTPPNLAVFSTPRHQPAWTPPQPPLFPDDKHRNKYRQFLEEFIRAHPEFLRLPSRDAEKEIMLSLDVGQDDFGWCIQGVLEEVAAQVELESKGVHRATNIPAKLDFYGSLSPKDVAAVVQRAKQLVRADPYTLFLDYRVFLHLLGVSCRPTGLLARDILEALRSEGLASPFEPCHGQSSTLTMEALERIELRTLELIREKGTPERGIASFSDLRRAYQVPRKASVWFSCVYSKLQMEALPHAFDELRMDFTGDLAIEEARVAVHRIFEHMRSSSYLESSDESISVILRRCRIHPLVTGFDPKFLINRLRSRLTRSSYRDYKIFMEDLYNEYYSERWWFVVEKSMEALVVKLPMRAITWTREELLAALRVNPSTPPFSFPQDKMLLCWALRKHYAGFSPEQKEAVDSFLSQNDTPQLQQWIRNKCRARRDFVKYLNFGQHGAEREVADGSNSQAPTSPSMGIDSDSANRSLIRFHIMD